MVERGQPLADAALGKALGLEDHIELGADRGDLLHPHAVDLVGREIGRGRLRERGGIERFAIVEPPDASPRARRFAQLLDQRDLAVERGIDFVGDNRGGLRAPIARESLGAGTPRDRGREHRLSGGRGAQPLHLAEREIEREIGRDIAFFGARPLDVAILIEHAGKGFEPREIGVAIRFFRDDMRVVEEIGELEIGAALLEDAIRADHRIKPVALWRVDLVAQRIKHDLAVERGGACQLRGIDRVELGEPGLGAREIGAHARLRGIVELGFGSGARPLVEPERGREFGAIVDRVVEDRVEQAVERGIGAARLRKGDGRLQRGNDGGGAAAREKGTTIHDGLLKRLE